MKILHTVEFYHPSVGGMQEVVKQLSERLVKLGHEVTVATSTHPQRTESVINGVRIESFGISGNFASAIRGGDEVARYQQFLRQSSFDIVTNFSAQQWHADLMLPMLDEIRAKKVIVPTGFSGMYLQRFKAYYEQMRTWLPKYDMGVYLSNDYRDINFAREIGITKTCVIPNGADEDEFLAEPGIDIRQRLGIPDDHFLILHVGSHTGLKGHREAMAVFRRAGIPNATLLIIGNHFHRGCSLSCRLRTQLFQYLPKGGQRGKKLMMRHLTRAETVAAYKSADLFLFPSNIECSPIVLFECMAAKLPFLTTEVGNSAEIIEWSVGGQLLPTRRDRKGYSHALLKESAHMLEAMYRQPERRRAMAESGHAAWREKFSWAVIAKEYESLYQQLLAG